MNDGDTDEARKKATLARARQSLLTSVYAVIEDVRPRLGRDFSVNVEFSDKPDTVGGSASIVYEAHTASGEMMYPIVNEALKQLKEHYGKAQGG